MRNFYIAALVCTAFLAPVSSLNAQQRPKSGSAAVLWSLGGTLVPYALASRNPFLPLEAIIVGPSLGHFYSGRPGRALGGIAVRLGGVALIAGAFATCADSYDFTCGIVLGFGGMTVITVSTIYDIATAPKSARRYNREHPLSVAPVIDGRRLGFAARVSF